MPVSDPATLQTEKIDLRIYLGMVFFRWQIIAVCFLYCLLGGVLYIHMTPKEYLTSCSIMAYRDPNSFVGRGNGFDYTTHRFLLTSGALSTRVVNRLVDQWGATMGGPSSMYLSVNAVQAGRTLEGPTLQVSVKSGNRDYAMAFLSTLIEEHRSEWESMQKENLASATATLEKELALLDEKVRVAQEDVIEYQRLHDIYRVSLRSSSEGGYLAALISRRRGLLTEMILLEHMYPALKNSSEDVIRNVDALTRETGALKPMDTGPGTEEDLDGERSTQPPGSKNASEGSELLTSAEDAVNRVTPDTQWHEHKLTLARLKLKEKDLLSNLTEEHALVKDVRKQIQQIEDQLKVAAEYELARLQDRHKALALQLEAVEAAEYKWQAKNMFANQRMGELRRLNSIVGRLESSYQALYTRLHDMKISEEMKIEHFSVVTPVNSSSRPSWPDPMKVMLAAVVAGLGSGFGLALAIHFLDNKVQSIRDVEKELGITYLGGVPYWVHSGLESSIRPIVTEEHSTGAVEAYRALRTTIINSVNKVNERIVFLTSADSKEGKTLTALNIAIMIAQMGKKVLLVDMDLRRGRLHRSLGLDKEPGISDVLKEGMAFRDIIKKTKVDNLFLAPTGSSIDDSAELLQSSDLVNTLVELQNEFDYIIVDTSPVLRVTDTAIVTTQGVGVVIYVARVNHTPKPLIRYSLEMLKDAKVLGLIMNSIEMHKISSLYYSYQYPNYAYYSNAYAYGYNYYYYGDGAEDEASHRRGARRRRRFSISNWLRKTLLPVG